MRVSRIQAEENRQTVISVASRLFREHGFDGIGLKDLMAGAGMTQGAFYKQFESKEDLAVQASRSALAGAVERWSTAAASNPEDPLAAIMRFYLSMGHCTEKTDGCPVVALGSDAARQGANVRAAFEDGIKDHLEMIAGWVGEDHDPNGKAMGVMATMVGAVLLARAVNDPKLSRKLLQSAAEAVLLQTGNRQECA
ncbi:transcriptional regulator [Azorhizobium caulinodans ORS 571]|uniref:Transcriptional regulator n=1 Tax=Azorhizobium caulinodans (strain ATCC 43989 / DSM 5975 / JCM 20966 / LMG 6465 / NBRC 14845 / NCIMB 13405 / ORS 571) TaxID=438753 RepID=A8I0P1_AZOC5|nr:TetR/AcrR family transcriptional regulator [Azorhizobium caulinodans]BAF87278.1 transcriptional regulator [Azorhizobium caulinodans ORS 571]